MGSVALTVEEAERIEGFALSYLGCKYEAGIFNCKDFVQAVYRDVGIAYPPLSLNVSKDELLNPPIGHVLFLKHKESTRQVSHVGIVISGRRCIHNSRYFGGQVVVTPLEELFKIYDLSTPHSLRGFDLSKPLSPSILKIFVLYL